MLIPSVGKIGVIVLLGKRTQVPLLGQKKVKDDSSVERPVTGIAVDEDGVNLQRLRRVAGVDGSRERFGELLVVVREDVGEGPHVRMRGDDIARRDNVLEAISAIYS